MELYEVPASPLFNGEDHLPDRFRGDPVAEQQWLFERAYANSEFSFGVSFRDRFLRGNGFEQYQFFRGEDTPP
jgi:hypothetical protein